MALTSSGQISMNDINVEFGRSGTTANSSLPFSAFSREKSKSFCSVCTDIIIKNEGRKC